MASLAGATELQLFMQSDVEPAIADLLLGISSASIRRHVGWSITAETGVTLTTQGDGGDVIWLPTKRLTAVASVVADGITLTVDTQYRWTPYGRLRRVGARWPTKENSVVVVFSHGYTAAPDDVKGVCLSKSQRLLENPGGMRSYGVGGIQVTYAGESANIDADFTESEIDALADYRLVVA